MSPLSLHSYLTSMTMKIRSRSQKSNHLLISSQWCNCASLATWAIGSQDRVQTRLFHSYMILVTLKIRSRTPKSNHSFWMFQINNCKFSQNPPNGSQTKSYTNADATDIHTKIICLPTPSDRGTLLPSMQRGYKS